MDHFQFRDGILHCDGIDLRALAEEFGTPLYVYAKRTLLDHVARFRAAFAALDPTICFSVKSCSNLSIMKLLREAGCCFDRGRCGPGANRLRRSG